MVMDQGHVTAGEGPLAGLRVVELASERACFAGKLFAIYGAEVIVVEPRGGHETRLQQESDLVAQGAGNAYEVQRWDSDVKRLTAEYEQARIDEVRNTPVVTVVDHPVGSARPTRSWALIVIAALTLGGLVGAGASFGGEFWFRQRIENAADYQEFETLRDMALNRLRFLPFLRNKWRGGESGPAR